jgi:putative tryptophan/tyrosine transport system substrate-binding protein
VLDTISPASNVDNFAALKRGLQDLGYIEGQNLAIEYRSADGRAGRFPELAAELVHLKVDVIVTRGTPAALAAKNATRTIPVVMAAIADPLLVAASLPRPGGNLTGLSALVVDSTTKRIQLLRELVAPLTRLAAFFNMANPAQPPEWEEIRRATSSMGIDAQLFELRRSGDIAPAFDAAVQQHVDAATIGLDAVTQENRRLIAELAARHRMPAIYVAREFADAGGLASYGPSYPDLYRRAASYVDKILRGAKPADLPIEQPTKFELIINLRTAKALGLTVPNTLLVSADGVIE